MSTLRIELPDKITAMLRSLADAASEPLRIVVARLVREAHATSFPAHVAPKLTAARSKATVDADRKAQRVAETEFDTLFDQWVAWIDTSLDVPSVLADKQACLAYVDDVGVDACQAQITLWRQGGFSVWREMLAKGRAVATPTTAPVEPQP